MPVAELFFVDTNVLLYAVDPTEVEKGSFATQWIDRLWDHRVGRLSWQVLNEFYWNMLRKFRVPAPLARRRVENYARWDPVGFSLEVLQGAWRRSDEASLAYWDSLILASAEAARCTYLLSEDFQEGRKFGSLTVVNPFRTGPETFGLNGTQ
jgi:predicted nucleic acid-binding protein